MEKRKISNNSGDDNYINSQDYWCVYSVLFILKYIRLYTVLISIPGWINYFLVWNQSEPHARHFTKQWEKEDEASSAFFQKLAVG